MQSSKGSQFTVTLELTKPSYILLWTEPICVKHHYCCHLYFESVGLAASIESDSLPEDMKFQLAFI